VQIRRAAITHSIILIELKLRLAVASRKALAPYIPNLKDWVLRGISIEKYGYSPDDLQWSDEDCSPSERDPWAMQIKNFLVRENCVYFILAEGADRVKIGIALNLLDRSSFIATSSPFPLTVLLTVPGGHNKEKEYHKRFAHLHAHGEWFLYKDELKEFIESQKSKSP